MLALAVLLSGPVFVWAGPEQAQPQSGTGADNTKANQRDRDKAAPTADQAEQNSSDLEIMRKIRRAVVQDKTLSTYAKNVKIIAQDGRVTLRGPVRSEEEKRAVEAKAVQVAGAGNVINEITLAPDNDNK
jgi:osmotically-inducible protein OsmY